MKRKSLTLVHLFVLATLLLGLAAPTPATAATAQAGQVPKEIQATFTVTNTSDNGPGSLRQAILDANASPGLDAITFAIGAPGSQQTIQPLSALPAISDPVEVDGWSQGGVSYTGPPLVELNGTLAGSSVAGLNITAGSSLVRGLVINGFVGTFAAGIRLQTGGGNWIYGNYIGVNFAGDARSANQRGIWIDNGSSNNRIGTNADGANDTAERNVISSNIDQNIWIYQPATTGNKIMGNYIGLNAAGTAAVGTNNQTVASTGILVQEASYTVIGTDGDGQGDALEGNVIGGNTYNINLTGTSINMSRHNRVSGNRIGTNAAGTASIGLQVEGVRVYVTENNVIGTNGDGVSDDLEGNLISGNSDYGVLLQQTGALNNVVAGNKIGTDITGMNAIPNGYGGSPRGGIYLGGYGNLIGSNLDGINDDLERNLISGNANNSTSGIFLQFVNVAGAVPNTIAGNWIGVDATGLAALPNNIGISGASQGLTVQKNVIAANTFEGIRNSGSMMLAIGNLIGVGADGVTSLGNGYYGIYLLASDNVVGGAGPGEANIIANNGYGSANFPDGVRVGATAFRNTLRGNRIFANAQLGIDLLQPAGVNINDANDIDTGGNNLQNYPLITFAQGYTNGTTRIQGTLNSNPSTNFTLDFYYSSAADPSGYGEGEFYLGEANVTTGADGNATFDVTLPVTLPPDQFVTATATHEDGSTSEFSLALAAGGVIDQPIQGLSAANDGPGYTNTPVTLSAGVSGGSGVTFNWALGDGSLAEGALVEHIYASPGEYIAIVTASNNGSSAQAQTVVTVLEPANINGLVWHDQDIDGIRGIGEGGLAGITVSAVGPGGAIQATTDAQGRYQIFTPQAGLYQVSAGAPGMNATTLSPVPVPMSTDGGTLVDFGLRETPPAGYGVITGRAWIDLDGSGYPEPDEEPLPGLALHYYGFQYPLEIMTTDANGLFSLTLPHERVYTLTMYAPGYFPPERRFGFTVWLDADAPLMNLHSPFARGGTVGGRVTNTSGAGVPDAILNISQPYNLTYTDANGDYVFLEQEPAENKGLGILAPFPYANLNGNSFRVFPLPPNSFVTENWLVERRGRLTVQAQQEIGDQSLPVGSVFFRLQGGFVDELMATWLNGEAVADALDAGTYTISPLPEYLPPNTLISPASRTVTITNETFASAAFTVTPAQSLAVECQAGGAGFPCTVEIYDSNGDLVTTVKLGGSTPATVITDLPEGSYEVVIIPSEPGWPETSTVVTLNGDTHAEVGYPFNPSNLQTISGYAYWDRCAPAGVRGNGTNCTETNIPSNNGLAVTLYNAAGSAVSATQTSNGSGWDTGFYAFPDLPPGSYRVEISLPGGFVAQTATSVWRSLDGYAAPEQVNFGYTRTENRFLSGYTFYDVNNNGSYDAGWDDPYPGAEITVSSPGGTLISSQTTASDGSFYVSPITSGEYRVVLTTPSLTLTRTAVVPASGGVPWVQFPLPPNDNRPRAIVFLDSNQNGQADPAEQRLGEVSVELFSQQCGGIAAPIETKPTNSDGLVLFTNPLAGPAAQNNPSAAAAAPGNPSGCVKIVTSTLPPDIAPANPNGAPMPKNSGVPVLLPVYPQGTLNVHVFWDADGDGQYDSGEPALAGGTATTGGQTKSYSENGAVFVLAQGSYSLSVVPPAGYQVSTGLPIPVVVGSGAALLRIPARVSGGINGAVIGPAGALAGTLVRLTHTATGQVFTTTAASGCAGWCSDAFYQFHNLPGGQYRLSVTTPPPGHVLASEPLVTYTAGQSLQQNLVLNPLGGISGVVYLDDNPNGQRDAGEPAASGYTVSLLNDSGLPVRTTVADANGGYLFDGLSAGVRYLVTLDLFVSPAASLSDSLTEAPGWFLAGMQPAQVNLGILMGGSDHTYNTVYGRVTANGAGVAGIRVSYYHWVAGEGCNQANPVWINRETYSDINGDYKLLTNMLPGNEHTYCIAARQSDGYQQQVFQATGSNFSYQTTGGAIIYSPGYWQRDVPLNALPGSAQPANQAGGSLLWSAFRDDNLNGQWDSHEPALPGVTLNGDATGQVSGLAEGFQTLSLTSPSGYLPLHGSSVPVWMNGADVTLPPLAFRFAGPLLVQAFSDDDGDGRQSADEPGLPGVGVSLSGPASASASTGMDGRASLGGLPNGTFVLAVTPPSGYAPLPNQSLSLSNGWAVSLALRPLNQVTGAVYEDWDGDGQRGSGELAVVNPVDVSASGLGSTRTALGQFRFWGASPGNYSVSSAWTAASPANLVLGSEGGGAAALPAVPGGTVRGAAWLDSNRDGLRQPWEAPLAGLALTLNGQTVATGADGRYAFYGIADGTYALNASLPPGLHANIPAVTLTTGRGQAIGLAVQPQTSNTLFLPLVKR